MRVHLFICRIINVVLSAKSNSSHSVVVITSALHAEGPSALVGAFYDFFKILKFISIYLKFISGIRRN